jgi:hypothetical protein
MTSELAAGRVPGSAEGAIIPPHLVEPAARLIEFGVKYLEMCNGGPPNSRTLASLRKTLDAARASASGRPSVTLEPQARTPYTTRQAAAVMGISERRVRHHAATGRLIAIRRGRDWAIDRQSAEDYRRERTR